MMKNTSLILILLAILSMSMNVNAGTINGAKIVNVRVDYSGKGIIKFDKAIVDGASCVTSTFKSHLSFDSTTEGGKIIYASAMAAKLNESKVSASTLGKCKTYNGSYVEDVKSLWFL